MPANRIPLAVPRSTSASHSARLLSITDRRSTCPVSALSEAPNPLKALSRL